MKNFLKNIFEKDTPNVIRVSRTIMLIILSMILMIYGMVLAS
jgi:hypothetical protein